MFSSPVVLFALANAASVFAQATTGFDVFSLPVAQSSFSVGSVLPIAWAPETTTGTISLELIGGADTSSLNPILVVVSSIPSQQGSYNWTIPSGVGTFATYGLNLTLDVNTNTFQYSSPFHITGGSDNSSSPTVSGSGSSVVSSTSTSGSASGTVAPSTNSTLASLASSTTYTTVVTTRVFSSTSATPITTTTTPPSNVTVTKASISSSSSTATATTTSKNGAGAKMISGLLAVGSVFVFALAL